MATKQPDSYKPLSNAQLRAGVPDFGDLTAAQIEVLEALDRTYSWYDRFLRPGFVIEEAEEILADISVTGDQRINYARLESRRIPSDSELLRVIKVWATREISFRRQWIGTLKWWRWGITLMAPVPAFVFANLLVHWITTTC